eukprot:TRINITY_DN10650_c0_g1_i2.p1 TRINITY_DN10650_c0_g1~~TRINITY_DN10650_c0_g1_i2.p1  ORF type:complete len:236 (+),score=39.07 TRINITY_DN10650_c0_g1_i2:105-812(+)
MTDKKPRTPRADSFSKTAISFLFKGRSNSKLRSMPDGLGGVDGEDWDRLSSAVKQTFARGYAEEPLDILNTVLGDLLHSKTATSIMFAFTGILSEQLRIMHADIINGGEGNIIPRLKDCWRRYVSAIVPFLEAIFIGLRMENAFPTDQSDVLIQSMVGFRDIILLSEPVQVRLSFELVQAPVDGLLVQMMATIFNVRQRDANSEVFNDLYMSHFDSILQHRRKRSESIERLADDY